MSAADPRDDALRGGRLTLPGPLTPATPCPCGETLFWLHSEVRARRNLEKIDHALLTKSKFVFLQDVLIKPLRSLEGVYDYIFLDTAPNATTPTIAAYKAAKWFLLTAMPDPFAIAGLTDALHDIEDAQNNGNDELRLLGVLLAGVDKRTRLANTLTSYVEETLRSIPLDRSSSRRPLVVRRSCRRRKN